MNKIVKLLSNASLLIMSNVEAIAAFVIMGIIFIMILPLPTWLVDGLIALNICISFLLVILSMYFPGPLSFTTFPAILLFTTIFRLALSITTTRLILLEADAGSIVQAFGEFVVGGNLAVGIVIFLILTIVQFLVITKGSERVAEVAARFTLDAMPGKQMSIDSDLRGGLMTPIEAKAKRNDLARTNQLFGAMDGAMKFVKGDAIAGIIIVLVNLVGGASIGVVQRGLSIGESMELFAVLTVGDGLVAQIPALLIALTAGMIITRVTNEDEPDTNIGREISQQMSSQPKAWIVAGIMMCGFSLIPGMPTKTFLFFAVASTCIGVYNIVSARRISTGVLEEGDEAAAMAAKMKNEDLQEFSVTVEFLILMNPALKDSELANSLIHVFREERNELVTRSGYLLPKIFVEYRVSIPESQYVFSVSEVPAIMGFLSESLVALPSDSSFLSQNNLRVEFENNDIYDSPLKWISYAEIQNNKEIAYKTCLDIARECVREILRKTGPKFLGIKEAQKLLNWMEGQIPDLHKELIRTVTLPMFADVLQRLASEGVSLRSLPTIIETLVEHAQNERDPAMLIEYIRIALKDEICHEYSVDNVLNVYLLGQETEDVIRDSIRQTTSGGFLTLDPDSSQAFLSFMNDLKQKYVDSNLNPVLLVAQDIRRYIWLLLKDESFSAPVLSFSEVNTRIQVNPLSRIEL